MPSQRVDEPQARLQEFLAELGGALVGAGLGVTEAAGTLRQAAIAMGAPDAQLIVFPTALIVSIPGVEGRSGEATALRSAENATLRFDQLTALYALADKARRAAVTPDDGLWELEAIRNLRPRFRWWMRIAGHGVAAAGVSLLLQPGWLAVILALALGMAVGCWVLVSASLVAGRVLAPAVAALGVGVVVFALAAHGIGHAPMTELVPPLMTYLPGSVVTVAVGELAAGDMIAGSSRLVHGAMVFTQLALGVLAADVIVGLPRASALETAPAHTLGALTPWLGVLFVGAGYFLLYCGPRGSLGWLLAVLLVAYAGQVIGSATLGGLLSGLVGAVLMTLTAYTVQAIPSAPPVAVLFLPGFWLLVPGAVGLIGLTRFVGAHASTGTGFLGFAGTILTVSAGVLIGTAGYRLLFRYAPVSWGLRRA